MDRGAKLEKRIKKKKIVHTEDDIVGIIISIIIEHNLLLAV